MKFDLLGSIDPIRFKGAFELLVQQSDAMRTVFRLVDGVPMQQVLNSIDHTLEVVDSSVQPQRERWLKDWIDEHNQQNFDLSRCAFQSALIKLDSEHQVWYLNQHHLITDAWGVTTQFEALCRFYRGQHDLIPNFSEYLEYETRHLKPVTNGTSVLYWKNKLKHRPPLTRLYGYTDQVLASSSQRATVELGLNRTRKLKALAAHADFKAWTEHLSIFTIFVTLLFAYLYRVTGQQKLSIGTPAHNRSENKFKKTPGVFIQFFPLFMEVEPGISFAELYSKVRAEINEFMINAVPGAVTAEANRSFQVVLNYIHATFKDFNGIPVKSQWVHPGHSDPHHHLRMQVHDFDDTGNITLDFDLNNQIFQGPRQSDAPGHFMKLLDAFLEDTRQSIESPSLLSPAEFQQLVVHRNISNIDYSGTATVLDLFYRQVEKRGNQPAVVCEGQSISYTELDERSSQLAHHLIANGVSPGGRVVLLMNRSIELIVSIWGVLKCGACYVPIDPASPRERLDSMLDDLDAAAVLTGGNTGYSYDKQRPSFRVEAEHLAYIIYTSGTTGVPKGVMISHGALSGYLQFAAITYPGQEGLAFPLFTTLAFDLTVTSIFTPLISGGKVVVYPEPETGPDLSILRVIEQNLVDIIKLTPSHIALLGKAKHHHSKIKKFIVGGEDFKTGLARHLLDIFGDHIEVYNEYGPTEATVGCMVHKLEAADLQLSSVPIGRPIPHMQAYLLDPELNPVPQGVTGEIYLSGSGVATGYWNNGPATREKFIDNPFTGSGKMYRTGDLARWNDQAQLEFLGRKDRQVKIGGIRMEPGEIEAVLTNHPAVETAAVELQQRSHQISNHVKHCKKCGLPSNYPASGFDSHDICELCRSFENYQHRVKGYFGQEQELRDIIARANEGNTEGYHCLVLLSGGKDSTYALARLVEMGFRVLAFTLDNGYISDEAKSNIKRVVKWLKVDHVFGRTRAMNAIFVDSLKRHGNVCNGCFKTIYTLSTNLAVERHIPIIVTGLSRGQFFETRLTEELFRHQSDDFTKIDQAILEARKAYHRTDDAVKQLLDVTVFEDGHIFDQIKYLDFYRYCGVSLEQMLDYLEKRLPWVRPMDTGRSTNCLINKVGIYEHKRRVGYSNYAFPYSWDVRVGHKTRDASLNEINEEIDEAEVMKIMNEIGYDPHQVNPETQYLVAYITAGSGVADKELRNYLADRLPEYMIPRHFIRMTEMPLTANGKIDYCALPPITGAQSDDQVAYRAPETQVEQMLRDIWLEVLQLPQVGVDHNFIHVGGNSLAAIRLTARINEAFQLDLPLNKIFEYPTISGFGKYVEATIDKLLQETSPE